jgi:hypothetical protein
MLAKARGREIELLNDWEWIWVGWAQALVCPMLDGAETLQTAVNRTYLSVQYLRVVARGASWRGWVRLGLIAQLDNERYPLCSVSVDNSAVRNRQATCRRFAPLPEPTWWVSISAVLLHRTGILK